MASSIPKCAAVVLTSAVIVAGVKAVDIDSVQDTSSLRFRPTSGSVSAYEHTAVIELETTGIVVETVVDEDANEQRPPVTSRVLAKESTHVADSYDQVEGSRVTAITRKYEKAQRSLEISNVVQGNELPAQSSQRASLLEGQECRFLWDPSKRGYVVDTTGRPSNKFADDFTSIAKDLCVELSGSIAAADAGEDALWEIPPARFADFLATFGALYHLPTPEALSARPPVGTRDFRAFPSMAAGVVPMADILLNPTGEITAKLAEPSGIDGALLIKISVDIRGSTNVGDQPGLRDALVATIPEGMEVTYNHPISVAIVGSGQVLWWPSSGSLKSMEFEGDLVVSETGDLRLATNLDPADGPSNVQVTQRVEWQGRIQLELNRR